MLSLTIKIIADVELAFSGVERIQKYIDKPEREAEWENKNSKSKKNWL